MSHRRLRAISISASLRSRLGMGALCAVVCLSAAAAQAQERSRLEDVTPRAATQRSSRARVPDARLYDDMTVIRPARVAVSSSGEGEERVLEEPITHVGQEKW